MLYQDQLQTGLELEFPDSGNEVDAELESDDDCPWKINLSIVDLENLTLNDPSLDKGVWYLNDDAELGYLSPCASQLIPLDTKTDIGEEARDDCNI